MNYAIIKVLFRAK